MLPRGRTEVPDARDRTVNRWGQHREAVRWAVVLDGDEEVREKPVDCAPVLRGGPAGLPEGEALE
ncbi:hypothetical protein ACFWOG_27890 [Kitasatospora sp. NPDC058406]|uniref:hypothetical protein n=1 Tax=Kitasatospora sp. NPDC058406 TaxID=3346483 RepID=UPI00365F3F8C